MALDDVIFDNIRASATSAFGNKTTPSPTMLLPMGGRRLGNTLGDTSIFDVGPSPSRLILAAADEEVLDDIASSFRRLIANLYAASSSSYDLAVDVGLDEWVDCCIW